MADDLVLDLVELRHLESIAKRPRVVSLISSEIRNLEKVLFLSHPCLFMYCVGVCVCGYMGFFLSVSGFYMIFVFVCEDFID